jgi:hypothetical protein
MASIKYGPLDPSPKTKEYPVAASQYFYHEGIAFVYLDSSGNLTKAITATTTLFGWAIVPKGRGAGSSDLYWLSSATAGADKIPVVLASDNYEFLVPGIITVTAAMTGGAWDLLGVNDGSQTLATGEAADFDTSSTDVLILNDLGVNRNSKAAITDGVVIINPAKIQAD